MEKGAGKFPKPAIFAIWRAIISGSLLVEKPFKIVTVKNAPSQVFEYFGNFNNYELLDSSLEVCKKITNQDVGVIDQVDATKNIPAGMQIFAQIGNFVAFAKISER
jgi:hypothetical protein